MLQGLIEAGGKVLGGARFSLLSILPGALVIGVITTLVRAHLYDLDAPVNFDAVLPKKEDAATLALGAFLVFVGGVILRPFEAALVQLLEGYWTRPSPLAPLRGTATERHRRRRNRAIATIRWAEQKGETDDSPPPGAHPLHTLALDAKAAARWQRRVRQAQRLRSRYPTEVRTLPQPDGSRLDKDGELMATGLGNALLRGERLSGDRYGLDIMSTYWRIYPFVSERLNNAVTQQLDLVAATASLCVSLGLCTMATLPLVLRIDAWSLLPLLPAVMSVLAYRGAIAAALALSELLCSVYDLHRFDLVKAFRYKLERKAVDYVRTNEKISHFLAQDMYRLDIDTTLASLRMDHSVDTAATTDTPAPQGSQGSQGPDGNGST